MRFLPACVRSVLYGLHLTQAKPKATPLSPLARIQEIAAKSAGAISQSSRKTKAEAKEMTAEADQPRAEAEASKNTADEAKLPEIGEIFRNSMRFFRDGSQKKSGEQTSPERAQGQEER